MRSYLKTTAIALALTAAAGSVKADGHGGVEVLHWWTSGGEAKSVAVLQKEFRPYPFPAQSNHSSLTDVMDQVQVGS